MAYPAILNWLCMYAKAIFVLGEYPKHKVNRIHDNWRMYLPGCCCWTSRSPMLSYYPTSPRMIGVYARMVGVVHCTVGRKLCRCVHHGENSQPVYDTYKQWKLFFRPVARTLANLPTLIPMLWFIPPLHPSLQHASLGGGALIIQYWIDYVQILRLSLYALQGSI